MPRDSVKDTVDMAEDVTDADHAIDAEAWLSRDVPEPDYLLGSLLHTSSRAMLVAPTGLGKTQLAMAMAGAIATGSGFLHWQARRAATVLYVDGEMPKRLVKRRIADLARRLGTPPKNLHVLSRSDVPMMPPLNTEEGRAFLDAWIKRIGHVDLIVFDNISALLTGVMKDEEPWQQVMPLVLDLTSRDIGQWWIHHTGHDETRSYGSKIREWHFDTVMFMERAETNGADIAFKLTFTKARERDPDNREEFEEIIIRLHQDQWTAESTEPGASPKPKVRGKQPEPLASKYHQALLDALSTSGVARPGILGGRPSVNVDEWKAECSRTCGDNMKDPKDGDAARALFSKYKRQLLAADWIAFHGPYVAAIKLK